MSLPVRAIILLGVLLVFLAVAPVTAQQKSLVI